MFLIDSILLLAGLLLLAGIVSSKFSNRVGLPVLVLFLGIGMLAGEDGLGLEFDDFVTAHAIGTVALAFILFDGGLQTPVSSLRLVWKPASLLATVGVLGTAAVTGVAAAMLLDIPWLDGLLLGSIVGSTDAAAVFAVLRSQGVQLRKRLAATLEVESASNDPMAIFLTVGCIELLTARIEPGLDVLRLFFVQMGVGAVVGAAFGWLTVRVVNAINLPTAALYPVLAATCGLITFGLAATLGGSGFLAIYIAGLVIGNHRTTFQRGSFLFMDALAWIAQITMFVVLGLLSAPRELVPIAGPALAVTAVLILVARPLSVIPLLLPFGYSVREHLLIAWVGLKGAVPIILATFPFMFGLPEGRLLFNVVFFVVLVSATLQGWSLPHVVSWLGLREERPAPPAATLELVSLRDLDGEIFDYEIDARSPLAGRFVRDLHFPDGAVVALITRGTTLVPPRGSTRIEVGDRLFVIARSNLRRDVDRVLAGEEPAIPVDAGVTADAAGLAPATTAGDGDAAGRDVGG
jgi:cell volume regulation protein A